MLTVEDYDLLIEACDAWVNRKQAGDMVTDLVTAMLMKGDGKDEKAQWKQEQTEKRRKSEIEAKLDADRATVLKAKLILMRQELTLPSSRLHARP